MYVGLRDDFKQEVTIWDSSSGRGLTQKPVNPALAWWLPKFPEK